MALQTSLSRAYELSSFMDFTDSINKYLSDDDYVPETVDATCKRGLQSL